MICSLCGFEFREEIIDKSCYMCLMNNHCRFIKCPNCGYEIPAVGIRKLTEGGFERSNGKSNLKEKIKNLKINLNINWRKEKDEAN